MLFAFACTIILYNSFLKELFNLILGFSHPSWAFVRVVALWRYVVFRRRRCIVVLPLNNGCKVRFLWRKRIPEPLNGASFSGTPKMGLVSGATVEQLYARAMICAASGVTSASPRASKSYNRDCGGLPCISTDLPLRLISRSQPLDSAWSNNICKSLKNLQLFHRLRTQGPFSHSSSWKKITSQGRYATFQNLLTYSKWRP